MFECAPVQQLQVRMRAYRRVTSLTRNDSKYNHEREKERNRTVQSTFQKYTPSCTVNNILNLLVICYFIRKVFHYSKEVTNILYLQNALLLYKSVSCRKIP